jgi:hypothetical protein
MYRDLREGREDARGEPGADFSGEVDACDAD